MKDETPITEKTYKELLEKYVFTPEYKEAFERQIMEEDYLLKRITEEG